jgi:hypothetical protein
MRKEKIGFIGNQVGNGDLFDAYHNIGLRDILLYLKTSGFIG